MIEVKEAIRTAIEKLAELDPTVIPGTVALEEVDSDSDTWLITLGFNRPKRSVRNHVEQMLQKSGLATQEEERVYKVISIDSSTGEFLSMKIREL